MSTAGTLYDEIIRYGSAKLLSAQTFSNVTFIDFVAPLAFALGYRTFWFDFDSVTCSISGAHFRAYVSADGGSTFQGDYLWSMQRMYSHGAADTYGSVAFSPGSAGGDYRGSIWVSDAQYSPGPYYMNGYMCFNRQAAGLGGVRNIYGTTTYRHPSLGIAIKTHGSVPWAGGWDWNAIRLQYNTGTMSGMIRCYGLKTGS